MKEKTKKIIIITMILSFIIIGNLIMIYENGEKKVKELRIEIEKLEKFKELERQIIELKKEIKKMKDILEMSESYLMKNPKLMQDYLTEYNKKFYKIKLKRTADGRYMIEF